MDRLLQHARAEVVLLSVNSDLSVLGCVRTDIDRQWTIPFGTPEQIAAAVREAIEAFGSFNGGCILHGEVGQEVPFVNIEALYSAFYRYGRYPLDWRAQ